MLSRILTSTSQTAGDNLHECQSTAGKTTGAWDFGAIGSHQRMRLSTDTRLGFSRRHATNKGEKSIMYPRAFCLAALVSATLTITSADAQAVGG